jgi:hypothetical protein
MTIEDAPACPQHAGDVRMTLRTLHSDQAAPAQLLGVFVCPECGRERRLPIDTRPADGGPAWGT